MKTVTEALKKLASKDCSAVELAEECLAQIQKREKDIGAYLEVFDDVVEQARLADERRAEGDEAPLLGVPVALKDNILAEGRVSSAGSRILERYKAPYDATAVRKLKEAGAVFMGRTNMDEFGMGSSTENSAFQKTKNPHDITRVPGGSSGGSAAVVAYGGALAALGSDTGGSIRLPASFCGTVGLKPTYGTVSRFGLIAMASSLEVIGPLTQSVADSEILFDAIKGRDENDMTSRDPGSAKDMVKTIGVPRHFIGEGVDEDIRAVFDTTLKDLQSKGYKVKDIELPNVDYALSSYYIVMPAEASSNLSRFDGVRYGLYKEGGTLLEDYTKTRGEGFGAEAKRRILIGTYVLSSGYYDAYYVRAQALRREIMKDFEQAFASVDAIALPTVATPAFRVGEKSDPLSMYLTDIFTVPANLTGVPALSVPAGVVKREGSDLPVGLQLIAPHLAENRLFTLGKAVEGA